MDVELLLSAVANKKIQFSILNRVFWVVPIILLFNLQMGLCSTVSSGVNDALPTRLGIHMDIGPGFHLFAGGTVDVG